MTASPDDQADQDRQARLDALDALAEMGGDDTDPAGDAALLAEARRETARARGQ